MQRPQPRDQAPGGGPRPGPRKTVAHSSPSGSPARSLPNETRPVTPCHPGSGLSRMLLCESSLLPWVTVSTRRGSTCTHKPDPGPSRLSRKGRDRSSAKRGSPGVWGPTPPTPQADPAHVAYNAWLLHPWGVPPRVPVTRAGHREFSLGVLTVRMNQKSGCWRRGCRVAMTAVPVSCFFFFPCCGHNTEGRVLDQTDFIPGQGNGVGGTPHEPARGRAPWGRRRPRLPPGRPSLGGFPHAPPQRPVSSP